MAIWTYLLLFRGRFWLVRDESAPVGEAAPASVAVIIPARNEAAVIARTVLSILGQEYSGAVQLIVIDDHSQDDTAAVAAAAAASIGVSNRLTTVSADPLPPGWTGKLWALSQGLKIARDLQPDYFLFTDADIAHASDSIRALVSRAERDHLDLVSYMVRLSTSNTAEKWLIPAFVFFFLKLYPPAWIRDPHATTAGAAGGCILIRPSALERIGSIEAIRGEIIDDCALARRVKRGGPIWMGLTPSTRSTREYSGCREIRCMIARTAYTQLNHSAGVLLGTVIGMMMIYIAPVTLLFTGNLLAAGIGFLAYVFMMAAYLPMLRFYGRSAFWAPLLPAAALFYVFATVESAAQFHRGTGGAWKGRIQDIKED